MLTTSDTGRAFIRGFEALRLKPYYATAAEQAKNWASIGYGLRYYPGGREVKITDLAITADQALAMFNARVREFEGKIRPLVTYAALTQGQWDALVSFAYNEGVANFKGSHLLLYLNHGDIQGAADQFPHWKFQDGKVLAGLVKRRAAERAMFLGQA